MWNRAFVGQSVVLASWIRRLGIRLGTLSIIAYSLGNLLFDQPYPVECTWGALLLLELRGRRMVRIEAVPTMVEGGRVRLARSDWRTPILHRMGLESISEVR